jgi:hypothetical protein
MSSRVVGCVLLLMVFVAFKFPTNVTSQQPPENPNLPVRWEYRVFNAEANNCASENYLTGALNRMGQDGWELVSYQRISGPFPGEAEGEMLFKAAATGPGAAQQPQVADSFQGTINMKMAQVPAGGCQVLLKRQLPPPRKS